jgi:PAS domain S-box-containing protein
MLDYAKLHDHAEQRLRLIEENVRDYAMFVVDKQGRIASWNVGAERILGYPESEAIGMNCEVIFTPEDRAHGAVEHERGTARATGRAEDERWHMRKDRSRFWGSGVMTALKDPNGELVGYVKILRDETARKTAEAERDRAAEERIDQERRNAVLQERNRLAQEIHDTLAQKFTAISIQLEAAKDALAAQERDAQDRLDRVQQLARDGLTDARRSVWALRPQILEQNSLVAAFTRLADEARAKSGLAVTYELEGLTAELPPHVEDNLLRVAQEAIANALRHGAPTELKIILRFEGDEICTRIEDNGRGFVPEQVTSGFGLTIMRERIESLGGLLSVESTPGAGTRIEARVPAQREAQAGGYTMLEEEGG